MRTPVTLVTGAGGEIGHGLIAQLAAAGRPIVTLDLAPLEPALARLVRREFTGSITDANLLERVLAEFEVDLIVHLAALLSTRAEFTPVTAHHVNVDGTLTLLEFAQHEGESHGRPVVFLYPSSIAAYGLPDLPTKAAVGRVKRRRLEHAAHDVWLQQAVLRASGALLHAALQAAGGAGAAAASTSAACGFPASSPRMTMPSGGTSDYAPEMIHAAARGEPYACFVRPDTRIPFMAMPDAIDALMRLAGADRAQLSRTAYNLSAFSPTAQEIYDVVRAAFPRAEMTWSIDREASGHRRLVACRRGRQRRPRRLGLCAALRLPPRLRRVPDSHHPRAVPRMTNTLRLTRRIVLTCAAAGLLLVSLQAQGGSPMNALAERYVRLVLAMGVHDADYVDAYYGPPAVESRSGHGEDAAGGNRCGAPRP